MTYEGSSLSYSEALKMAGEVNLACRQHHRFVNDADLWRGQVRQVVPNPALIKCLPQGPISSTSPSPRIGHSRSRCVGPTTVVHRNTANVFVP